MKLWKKNLIVCWFGSFVTMIALSQIAPILPIYIKHFGINDTSFIEQISGIAFGVTYVISAIFSPIWGHVADRVGRKPMILRASLGMAIVVFGMGFAKNVYELVGLRMLQGTISGYCTACTTLIATQTEKKHAGWALGVLSTATISGSLLGPMFGGYIEEVFGMRNVFFIMSILLLIAFITAFLFVKEDFVPSNEKDLGIKDIWEKLPRTDLMVVMFVTSFMLQLACYSAEPIITVYISELSKSSVHIALIAGITFSASGLASILAAPKIGKISDEVGPEKVMPIALLAAGIIFIPQAFVKNPEQLMILRFVLGLATAGLVPSVNTMVKKITPDSLTGRVFGFNMSALYLGTFSGSIFGAQIASHFGIKYVFIITSILLIINALWVYEMLCKKMHSKVHHSFSAAH
ncbi:MFS transporter [Clostridium fermenticellae]|uniref:MFS transporter n=1 Tax=Clostridium fermenticellae TaxID=2068654 RepID=A0A386H430_9CLOT|nr:multidrug efflux MFS transporter [Clostridium fermenticellae]AYD40404.1 MFS transporter [Clostridium fermenticellae]